MSLGLPSTQDATRSCYIHNISIRNDNVERVRLCLLCFQRPRKFGCQRCFLEALEIYILWHALLIIHAHCATTFLWFSIGFHNSRGVQKHSGLRIQCRIKIDEEDDIYALGHSGTSSSNQPVASFTPSPQRRRNTAASVASAVASTS